MAGSPAPSSDGDARLTRLLRAIARGDSSLAGRLLTATPELATARLQVGATRRNARAHFFEPIGHYAFAGDTALHLAAAGHRVALAHQLLARGAGPGARNRRGAEPLHCAADTGRWSPRWQAGIIEVLLAAGADPSALDADGVAPLHRAVRTRSSSAVRALLSGGALPLA